MKRGTPLLPLVFAAIVALGAAIAFVLHRLSANVAAITVLGSSVAVANTAVWGLRVAGFRNRTGAREPICPWPLDGIRKATLMLGAVCCWFDALPALETSAPPDRPRQSYLPEDPCEVALCWAINGGEQHKPTRPEPRPHPKKRCAA